MKIITLLAVIAASLAICGCNPDKSADTQVMEPNGGVPMDAKGGGGAASNPSIPANVKSQIPGAGPAAGK